MQATDPVPHRGYGRCPHYGLQGGAPGGAPTLFPSSLASLRATRDYGNGAACLFCHIPPLVGRQV